MKTEIRTCVEMSLLLSIVSAIMASPVLPAVQETEGTAVQGSKTSSLSRTKRSHRSESHLGGVDRDQFKLLCPTVKCPPVSPTCQDKESIVFEYSFFNNRGRRVDVRCESCVYCLDLHANGAFSFRNKRSLSSPRNKRSLPMALAPVRTQGACPTSLRCPDVPSECHMVKMTNVLVQEQHCRRCPACFDGTMLA